ncbi:MAG: hypothetical protein EOO27_15950 [Comamonadaceae bacterium]|nr:MAG: hypothetical protein EOO27_15950 [Comamonadaceae bacterium]
MVGNTRTTVTTWGSMTNQILALCEHLLAEKVTCVVMEATGVRGNRGLLPSSTSGRFLFHPALPQRARLQRKCRT